MQNKNSFLGNIAIILVSLLVTFVAGFIIAKTGAWAFGIIPLLFAAVILGFYLFKNPFLGFLLIIFFLPFERVPTYELGGVNIKINTILGFFTIFTWILALMFNGKRWKVQPNAIAVPISLFVIAMMLSLTQALNLDRSFQVIFFILFTIALSILTTGMISDEEKLKKALISLGISSVIVGIFGLFQFGGNVIGLPASITLLKKGYGLEVFGFPRIQAFSMEPLYFANYLLIPIGLALAYFFGRVDFIKRWWLVGILALLLVNFILTVSRGAYIGLGATFLVFAIFYFKRVFTWKNIAIIIVLGLVFWGVSFALSKGKYSAKDAFLKQATLQDSKKGSESIQGRLLAFEKAFDAFKANPVLGIGIGNYGPYVKNYPAVAPITGWDIVNNQYLELAAETGIVGIIAFGLIILVLIMRTFLALKYAEDPFLKTTLIGLFAAFIGVMVQYNFFSTLYIIQIWVLIGLMAAVQSLILKKANT